MTFKGIWQFEAFCELYLQGQAICKIYLYDDKKQEQYDRGSCRQGNPTYSLHSHYPSSMHAIEAEIFCCMQSIIPQPRQARLLRAFQVLQVLNLQCQYAEGLADPICAGSSASKQGTAASRCCPQDPIVCDDVGSKSC